MQLEEKYAHVTLESIAQMTQEQIEDLQHQVADETQNLHMQLEMLQAAGGVSREMANQIRDYLPPTMVLESFTGMVTHTNYDMAKESLSTALKIVGVVGIIAAVGGLVYLFTRAKSNTPKQVNERGQAHVERLSKTCTAADSIVDKMFSSASGHGDEDEPSEEQLAEMERKSKAIQEKWEREAAERKKKASDEEVMKSEINSLTAFAWQSLRDISRNHGDFKAINLLGGIFSGIKWTFDVDYKELLLPAIDAAERFNKSGNEKDLEKIHHIIERRPTRNLESSFIAITQMIKRELINASVPGGGNWNSPDEAFRFFMDWARGPATPTDFDRVVVSGCILKGDFKFNPPNYSSVVKSIDQVLSIGDDLAKQEKRLKDVQKLPKELADALDKYVEATKENLKLVNMISAIIELEVTTYNQMLKYANVQLKSSLDGTMASLKALINDPEISPKMKQEISRTVSNLHKSFLG